MIRQNQRGCNATEQLENDAWACMHAFIQVRILHFLVKKNIIDLDMALQEQ